MADKTLAGLVEYAKAQIGKPYWYGTFGQAAGKSLYDYKKTQYPNHYLWAYAGETGVKVHDCVGLIKGYLWCRDPGDDTPIYNPMQDKSAEGMWEACTTKGAIATMPDVPGVLVFRKHHVGVYIGDGEVVEARGHAFGVVKTRLSSGGWDRWGFCPYIEETKETEETKKGDFTVEMRNLKKGCKGEDVRALQILLIGNGVSCGSFGADGDFGGATESAVREYQLQKRLVVDGIAGKNTMSSLLGVR